MYVYMCMNVYVCGVCVHMCVCVATNGARSITGILQIIKLLFFWLNYASWGLSVGILPTALKGIMLRILQICMSDLRETLTTKHRGEKPASWKISI